MAALFCALAVACGTERGPADAGPNCTQRASPDAGCTVANLACIVPGTCPASWDAAQAMTSCTGYGRVTLDHCSGSYRWIYYYGQSIRTCFYDATTSALEAAQDDNDNPSYCSASGQGSVTLVYGTKPPGCDGPDAGTVISTTTCDPWDAAISEGQ